MKQPKSKRSAPTEHTQELSVKQTGSSEQDIQRRAYEIHLARGGAPGAELEDWLEAERELRLPQPDAAQE